MKRPYILLKGDCVKALKKLPDNSINCVITDPPYNISRKNNFKTMGRNGIDFGEWDKNADILSWIKELPRIIDKDGSVFIFNDWRNLGSIATILEKEGFIVKDIVRWVKDNPMPRNRDRRYITDFEFAIWAVKKGAKWTFNRQSSTYDRAAIQCGLTPKSEKRFGAHPTQKPIKLMENIIRRHTNEGGGIILDPFMGSGSTGVAAIKLNRKFIGVELNDNYFNIASNRMKNCLKEKYNGFS